MLGFGIQMCALTHALAFVGMCHMGGANAK